MRKVVISGIIVFCLISTILLGAFLMSPGDELTKSAQRGKAPDFTLIDINNNEFILSEHRGEVVLINFFTIPAKACRLAMEVLKDVHERIGDEFTMISIDVLLDDTDEMIKEAYGMYTNISIFARDTEEERVLLKYSVSTVPMICIVNPNGYISFSEEGDVEEDILVQEIQGAKVSSEIQDFFTLFMMGVIGIVVVIAVIVITVIYFHNKKGP